MQVCQNASIIYFILFQLYVLNGCSVLHVNYISIYLLNILRRMTADGQGEDGPCREKRRNKDTDE